MVKYERKGRSRNIEDRRGASGARRSSAGPVGKVGAVGGIGGLLLVLALQFLGGGGGDLGVLLQGLEGAGQQQQAPTGGGIPAEADPDADMVEFLSFVLDDSQAMWAQIFQQAGRTDWRDAKLVLFEDAVQSGCGYAPAAMGPFYCSADEKSYLDLSFFQELANRFGAPGDLAQAYVVAHEIAHHVQHVLGISADVRQQKQSDPGRANELSVMQELQADCFSGVWAFTIFDQLEPNEVNEALRAAEVIGDDSLQRQAGAEVDPESWTHGSSEQRQRWFMRGFESGDPNQCDTFSATSL